VRRWTLITLILILLALLSLAIYLFLPADGEPPVPSVTPTAAP
jgi:hypothetical protein